MLTSFAAEWNYAFGFYGLAFLLLAGIAEILRRRGERRLPWAWLGLFGLGYGLAQGLAMLGPSLVDPPGFHLARVALVAASFLALFEFGRRGLGHEGQPGFRLRGYAPILIFAALGALSGEIRGLEATCRYALGLPGALCAGLALGRAVHPETQGERSELGLAAVALVAYALGAGLIVPGASFFPASVLDAEAFEAATGLPIQLIEALCALAAFAGLWRHHVACQASPKRPSLVRQWLVPGACLLLVGLGAVMADRSAQAMAMAGQGETRAGAETLAGAGPGAGRSGVQDDGTTWEDVSSRRLESDLPVLLATLLVMVVLVGLCVVSVRMGAS